MIKPTVGRIVLFIPLADKYDFGFCLQAGKPHAAIVTAVHGDRMVNLSVFDANGEQFPKTSVALRQSEDAVPLSQDYCEWMDFQKGQAAKTEALEAQLTRLSRAEVGTARDRSAGALARLRTQAPGVKPTAPGAVHRRTVPPAPACSDGRHLDRLVEATRARVGLRP